MKHGIKVNGVWVRDERGKLQLYDTVEGAEVGVRGMTRVIEVASGGIDEWVKVKKRRDGMKEALGALRATEKMIREGLYAELGMCEIADSTGGVWVVQRNGGGEVSIQKKDREVMGDNAIGG